MKTFNQFINDSDPPLGMICGLDRDNHFVAYLGLNRHSELQEVYDGSISQFQPIGDQYVTHFNHSLSSVSDSTRSYTSHLSVSLNHGLLEHYRTGDKSHVNLIAKHINEIDSDLRPTSAKHDLILYSGFPESPLARSGEWSHSKKSRVMTLPAYTSTSTDVHEAAKFTSVDEKTNHLSSVHHGEILPNSRHLVQLMIPSGTAGVASVRNISNNMHENEFLLARGHSFELHHRPTVIHNEYRSPLYIWHAHVFSKNPKAVDINS